ncbi:unnamed protein product [Urochloa humidicola]
MPPPPPDRRDYLYREGHRHDGGGGRDPLLPPAPTPPRWWDSSYHPPPPPPPLRDHARPSPRRAPPLASSDYLQDSDIAPRFQRKEVYGAWEQYLGMEHTDTAPKDTESEPSHI